MSTPTEKTALKLLAALEAESLREPSLLKCCTLESIQKRLRISDADTNQAIRFLLDHRAINAVKREDGMAVQPTASGRALLSAQAQSSSWTLDRRLVLYGVIVALLAAAISLYALFKPS